MKFHHRRHFLHLAAGVATLPVVSRVAWAQAYPTRPVRLIAGAPPGGGADFTARLIGQALSERLGRPFVIEFRPGAGGNIATEYVVRASPDGYTLLLVTNANTVNATLYEKLNYNFIRDIVPIASTSRVPTLWWCLCRFRRRLLLSSSPMPKLIRAKSPWVPMATVVRLTCPVSFSKCWPVLICSTFPIAAQRPP